MLVPDDAPVSLLLLLVVVIGARQQHSVSRCWTCSWRLVLAPLLLSGDCGGGRLCLSCACCRIETLRRPLQELRSRILSEAEASAAANAEITARWEPLHDLDVPQELWAAMEAQQQDCQALASTKHALITGEWSNARDRLAARWKGSTRAKLCTRGSRRPSCCRCSWARVCGQEVHQAWPVALLDCWAGHEAPPLMVCPADLREELATKEAAYVQLLRRQTENLDAMLAAMSTQASDLRDAYDEELEALERALVEVWERKQCVHYCDRRRRSLDQQGR